MCVKGGYDFVDVRDVAKGIILACDVVGKKRIKVVLPIMIAKIVAPFYEIL